MEEKGMPGVMCRVSLWEPLFAELPDAYVGALLGAALGYAKSGEEPDFDSALDGASAEVLSVAWSVIRADVDEQKARYMERLERAKYAAKVRRAKKGGAETGKGGIGMSDCLTFISEDEAQEAFYSYLDACREKGTDAYSFTLTFELTSLQLRRLCALRAALGYEGPKETLGAMLRAGGYSLANERLAVAESVVSRMRETNGAETGKEESG